MKIFKILPFLLVMTCSSLNIKEHIKRNHQQNIDNLEVKLKDKYKWLDRKLYNIVLSNVRLYRLERSEELKIINMIIALMDEESWRGKYFTGRLCKVLLRRNGKYVYEYHRARGWMQVMVYATSLKNNEVNKLYDPYIGIYWGVNIFMKGYHKSNGDMQVSLKNYNSGINSEYYNWTYINNIVDNFNEIENEI